MRIVLCDDNRLLCEALADVLQSRCHEVVAIETTVESGIAAVGAHKPDICILDLRFPNPAPVHPAPAPPPANQPAGIAAARAMKDLYPDTRILILSGADEPAAWAEALQVPIDGFLRKDQNVSHIADALEIIADGGAVFDPTISRHHAKARAKARQKPERSNSPVPQLTPREEEVLSRIVAGQTTRQMATEMKVATSTLRSYIKNVLAKLGAHSRLQAAAIGSRRDQLRNCAGQDPSSSSNV
jgi:two-component system nitrate/nitrite response regulator NarL